MLEDRAGRKDVRVGIAAADDLHSHRQASDHSRRYGGRWMTSEVDRIGEAPADQRINLFAIDLRRTEVFPSSRFFTGMLATVGVTSKSYFAKTACKAS